jgi:hypothetical protein
MDGKAPVRKQVRRPACAKQLSKLSGQKAENDTQHIVIFPQVLKVLKFIYLLTF